MALKVSCQRVLTPSAPEQLRGLQGLREARQLQLPPLQLQPHGQHIVRGGAPPRLLTAKATSVTVAKHRQRFKQLAHACCQANQAGPLQRETSTQRQ